MDLEDRLRSGLRSGTPPVAPTDEDWERIRERLERPRRSEGTRVLAAVVAFVVALAGIGLAGWAFFGGGRPTAGIGPRANGPIAFVAHPDGTGLANLTSSAGAADQDPVWSPDGSKVLFVRQSGEPAPGEPFFQAGVFTMNADGLDLRQILSCPASRCPYDSFAWSPDGSQLAFIADFERKAQGGTMATQAVEVANADGSGVRVICQYPKCAQGVAEPAWSPDGTRLAFSEACPGCMGLTTPPSAINVANTDGSGVRKLSNTACAVSESVAGCTRDTSPTWSPDGTQIAFYREPIPALGATRSAPNPPKPGVYAMRPDGSELRSLWTCSQEYCQGGQIRWSPEGSRLGAIVYGRSTQLRLILSSGGSTVLRTCGVGRCVQPGEYTWSPDGMQIALLGTGQTTPAYVIGADGTNMHIVAERVQCCIAWLPATAFSALPSPVSSAALGLPPTARPTLSSGRIAFETGSDVWTILSNGSGARRLTSTPGFDGYTAWSPDGTKIAFASDRPGEPNTNIFVMNADGSEQRALTNFKHGAVAPMWSPDGSQIAFFCSGRGALESLCLIARDGTGLRRIGNDPSGYIDASWSSRGEIAFLGQTSDPSGTTTIQVMRPWGGAMHKLITIPGSVNDMTWSPDGSTLAFDWNSPAGGGLYALNSDGSGLRHLVNLPGSQSSPTWSPDGRRIAFVQNRGGGLPYGIYTVATDGTGLALTQRATNRGAFSDLSWGRGS